MTTEDDELEKIRLAARRMAENSVAADAGDRAVAWALAVLAEHVQALERAAARGDRP